MYKDRKEVRDQFLRIRVNEYDMERLERILEAMGGQQASHAYQSFLRGLEWYEAELREIENKKQFNVA